MSCVAQRLLANPTGFVERHVQEVDVVRLYAGIARRGAGLGSADQRLDLLQFRAVHFAGLLAADEALDVLFDGRRLVFAELKGPAVFGDEVGMAQSRVVPDGNVARGLIGDVHIVPLLAQTDEGAAHGDHVVIGMRAEDHHALGENTAGVDGDGIRRAEAGLADLRGAAPCVDALVRWIWCRGGLPPGQPVMVFCMRLEDFDIDVVRRAAMAQQFLQAVLVVVFVE